MRRFLMTLAVLAMVSGLATPALAQDIAAMSFEQLTVSNTAAGLTATTVQVGTKAAARCVGVLETATIRIRVDGTAATASIGTLVPVGAFVDIRGVDNVRRFSAIRTGSSSGVLPLTCFPSPAETTPTAYLSLTPTPAVTASNLMPDGTVALPAVAFASDTDSGLYRIGANNIGLATNGAIAFDWSAARVASALPVFLPSGSAAAPALAFTSDAGNDSGFYLIGADNIGVALGGAIEANWTTTAFSPGASDGSALGTTALMWSDLFLAAGGVVNFNNGNVTLTHSAGKLVLALPAPTSSINGLEVTMTGGSATPGTIRALVGSATTYTSMSSGNIVGARGQVTVGGNLSGTAFAYGAQGKVIGGANSIAVGSSMVYGVMGQLDLSGTTVTNGYVAAVGADIFGVTSGTVAADLFYGQHAAGGTINSMFRAYGTASYVFQFDAPGAVAVSTAGTGAGECAQTGGVVFAKAIPIKVDGTNYWIPICTAK